MSNPVLSEKTFDKYQTFEATEHMTIKGTAGKTMILLFLLLCTGSFSWSVASQAIANGNPGQAMIWVWGGAIAGLILAIVTSFKPFWSPFTAPLYALAEGLFLGAISSYYNAQFEGIVVQAVSLTLGVLFMMLLAYQSGWIKATEKFKTGVFAATGSIFLVYMATMVLSMFGINIPYIHGSGMIGIGFSIAVVIIASLNLIIDFDLIERGAEMQAPKAMEWYGAFALMVTLVWLYLEILRLLSKLSSRD
jgi:uncharacterized YccA/Bax inhibitor family protein